MSSLFAAFSLQVASAESRSYNNLTEISDEIFYLGDIVKIQGSWCYATKKPTDKTAKQKLQIYIGTSWRNVGLVKFIKSPSICSGKNSYLQIFEWEVDQLGTLIEGRGQLRLRDSSSKPSKYASVYVFDSAGSADMWQKNRESQAGQMMMCLLGDGQWDDSRKICVGGGLGLR
jgi:hypothetical protein